MNMAGKHDIAGERFTVTVFLLKIVRKMDSMSCYNNYVVAFATDILLYTLFLLLGDLKKKSAYL